MLSINIFLGNFLSDLKPENILLDAQGISFFNPIIHSRYSFRSCQTNPISDSAKSPSTMVDRQIPSVVQSNTWHQKFSLVVVTEKLLTGL